MALPPNQTKEHFDSDTDSPAAAQPEFAANVDKFNALKSSLGDVAQLDVGDGLQSDAGELKVGVSATDSVVIDCGDLP